MQEVRAVENVTLARNLMLELQVLLEQWKENSETSKARMKQDKATVPEQGKVENHRAKRDTKMKCNFGERMTRIESYWKDLNLQVGKGYNNTCSVISLLRKIEKVLKEVPRSHWTKLQARFSSLRAEAETIIDDTTDQMKMQVDKKPNLFRELGTSSHGSS
ncbi:hypothetical protein M8C21_024279 [Ambrosia artemisiifolia]|uniref:Uncharacterized protein n=1 Tax=Ambrosia artemisiifolia TaxID=4212 RepID=A0AAD5CEJ4_AMBAR|nr:hypothetical protein M8C21_024279 [Ambrosia artemisiifolia]